MNFVDPTSGAHTQKHWNNLLAVEKSLPSTTLEIWYCTLHNICGNESFLVLMHNYVQLFYDTYLNYILAANKVRLLILYFFFNF